MRPGDGESAVGLKVLWLAYDEVSFHGLPALLKRLPEIDEYHVCATTATFLELIREGSFDVCILPESKYTPVVAPWIVKAGAHLVLTSSESRGFPFSQSVSGARRPYAWFVEQRITAHELQSIFARLTTDGGQLDGDGASLPLARANRLTERERLVLQLLLRGRSNQQIARALGISIHGVKRHVSNLLLKLDCSNRTEMAMKVVRLGLSPPAVGP
jgi:DNA-binding CsgD family transcriptional regulator